MWSGSKKERELFFGEGHPPGFPQPGFLWPDAELGTKKESVPQSEPNENGTFSGKGHFHAN